MKKLFLFAAAAASLGIAAFALTQTAESQGLVDPPKLTVPFPGQTDPIDGPADYIRTIYKFGLGFGALLAMVMIVIGAVQYTLSEAVTSKEDAKARIMSAIWGLVLLLAATLILYTVNPDIPNLYEPEIGKVPQAPPRAPSADRPFAPQTLCGNGKLDSGEPCDLSSGRLTCSTDWICRDDCRCHPDPAVLTR